MYNFKIYLWIAVCFIFVCFNISSFYAYAEDNFFNLENYYINSFNSLLKENIISDKIVQEIVQKTSRVNVTDLNRTEDMLFNPLSPEDDQMNGSKFIIKDNVTLIQQGSKSGFDKNKILEEKEN